MRKVFMSCIIIIILTNFIFYNECYADSELSSGDSKRTTQAIEDMSQDSSVNINGTQKPLDNIGGSSGGTVMGVLVGLINIVPFTLHVLVSECLNHEGVIDQDNDAFFFSIKNIITDKYLLFDADVFKDIKSSTNGLTLTDNDFPVIMRKNVALWFTVIRDIAIVINLCILVYISINMAVLTMAKDRAKYKEMLYNWLISMLIIFILPYLMTLISTLSNVLTQIFKNIMDSMDTESFETTIMENVIKSILDSSGYQMLFYSLMYWFLLWNQFKMVVTYGKRLLTSCFLVIISPLITVTYSVDKLGDHKAQAFDKWIHEYSLNLFIQPIHCVTYLIFMYMANNIAIKAPLIGIIFLMYLTKAQKIMVSVLGISANALKEAGQNISFKQMTGKLKGMIPSAGMPK